VLAISVRVAGPSDREAVTRIEGLQWVENEIADQISKDTHAELLWNT
jgi:hypothetical protein